MAAAVVNGLQHLDLLIVHCAGDSKSVIRSPRCCLQAQREMFFAVQWRGKYKK